MLKKLVTVVAAISFTLTGTSAARAEVSPTSGYDISWPQCGSARNGTLPTPGPFSVIGVNGGRVWDTNACLKELLQWAGEDTQLYINNGNPYHYQSARWPLGKKVAGRTCKRSAPKSAECSFIYGYLGAQDSYKKAVAGFAAAGFDKSPAENVWWLDIELVNSWRQSLRTDTLGNESWYVKVSDRAKNRANISGAIYYLENVAKVSQVGIYSTTKQWTIITGGETKEFSDHPVWYANGRGEEAIAVDACDGFKYDGEPDQVSTAFTGSAAIISQYIDSDIDLDVNVPCTGYAMTETSLTGKDVSVRAGRWYSLTATLKTSFGTPAANRLVTFTMGDKVYQVRTNSKGVATKRLKANYSRVTTPVTVTFDGDVILSPSTASNNVTVR
jgi:hypothetical protein